MKALTHEQSKEDSTRAGRSIRARGRGRSPRGRDTETIKESQVLKALHKNVIFVRKLVMLRKIVQLEDQQSNH
jgi:hypothetical protein